MASRGRLGSQTERLHAIEALRSDVLSMKGQGHQGGTLHGSGGSVISNGAVVGQLRDALTDHNWMVRQEALATLGEVLQQGQIHDIDEVAPILPLLLANLADNKVAIRRSSSNAVQLWLRASQNKLPAVQYLTDAGLSQNNKISSSVLTLLQSRTIWEDLEPKSQKLLFDACVSKLNSADSSVSEAASELLEMLPLYVGRTRFSDFTASLAASDKERVLQISQQGDETDTSGSSQVDRSQRGAASQTGFSAHGHDLAFGIVPSTHVETASNASADVETRVSALQQIIAAIVNSNAQASPADIEGLINLLCNLLGNHQWKVVVAAQQALSAAAMTFGWGLRAHLDLLMKRLILLLGDAKLIVRQENTKLLKRMMQTLTPMPVISFLMENTEHSNWRVREEIANIFVLAMVSFDAQQLDHKALTSALVPCLRDSRYRVKAAALGALAMIRDAVGTETVWTWLSAHQLPQAVLQAIERHFTNHQNKPTVGEDGLIEFDRMETPASRSKSAEPFAMPPTPTYARPPSLARSNTMMQATLRQLPWSATTAGQADQDSRATPKRSGYAASFAASRGMSDTRTSYASSASQAASDKGSTASQQGTTGAAGSYAEIFRSKMDVAAGQQQQDNAASRAAGGAIGSQTRTNGKSSGYADLFKRVVSDKETDQQHKQLKATANHGKQPVVPISSSIGSAAGSQAAPSSMAAAPITAATNVPDWNMPSTPSRTGSRSAPSPSGKVRSQSASDDHNYEPSFHRPGSSANRRKAVSAQSTQVQLDQGPIPFVQGRLARPGSNRNHHASSGAKASQDASADEPERIDLPSRKSKRPPVAPQNLQRAQRNPSIQRNGLTSIDGAVDSQSSQSQIKEEQRSRTISKPTARALKNQPAMTSDDHNHDGADTGSSDSPAMSSHADYAETAMASPQVKTEKRPPPFAQRASTPSRRQRLSSSSSIGSQSQQAIDTETMVKPVAEASMDAQVEQAQPEEMWAFSSRSKLARSPPEQERSPREHETHLQSPSPPASPPAREAKKGSARDSHLMAAAPDPVVFQEDVLNPPPARASGPGSGPSSPSNAAPEADDGGTRRVPAAPVSESPPPAQAPEQEDLEETWAFSSRSKLTRSPPSGGGRDVPSFDVVAAQSPSPSPSHQHSLASSNAASSEPTPPKSVKRRAVQRRMPSKAAKPAPLSNGPSLATLNEVQEDSSAPAPTTGHHANKGPSVNVTSSNEFDSDVMGSVSSTPAQSPVPPPTETSRRPTQRRRNPSSTPARSASTRSRLGSTSKKQGGGSTGDAYLVDAQELEVPQGSLETLMKKASTELEKGKNQEQWTGKCEGLQIFRQIAVHHGESAQPVMSDVVAAVVAEIKNLRSSVSRVAILTVGDLAFYCGKCLDPFVDRLVATLQDKAAAEASTFMKEEVSAALEKIVDFCSPSKSLSAFLNVSDHKNKEARCTSAQFLCGIVARVGPKILSSRDAGRLFKVTAKLLQDQDQVTRFHARKIVAELMPLEGFDASVTRHLSDRAAQQVKQAAETIATKGLGNAPMAGSATLSATSRRTRKPTARNKSGNASVRQGGSNTFKDLTAALNASDWKDRNAAIDDLIEAANSKHAAFCANGLDVFFAFIPKLTDVNSKVNLHALEALADIVPILPSATWLEAALTELLSAVGQNLISKQAPTRKAAEVAMQLLLVSLDGGSLGQPLSSVFVNANIAVQQELLPHITASLPNLCSKGPKTVERHVVKPIVKFLNEKRLAPYLPAFWQALYDCLGDQLFDMKPLRDPEVATAVSRQLGFG